MHNEASWWIQTAQNRLELFLSGQIDFDTMVDWQYNNGLLELKSRKDTIKFFQFLCRMEIANCGDREMQREMIARILQNARKEGKKNGWSHWRKIEKMIPKFKKNGIVVV